MTQTSRVMAFVAYLLSLPGALIVLFTQRDDRFATHHARQSLAIWLAAIGVPLLWAVVAWVLAWIPVIGAVMGVALFALVLAVYTMLIVSWIAGMVFSLQGVLWTMPLLGRWITPRRARPVVVKPPPELAEQPPVIDL